MWVVEIDHGEEKQMAVFDDERLMRIQFRTTWGIPLSANLESHNGVTIHSHGRAITLRKVEAMNQLPGAVLETA